MEALEWMSSIDRYSAVISSATELSQSFERNELQSMYQRVADRIRTADTSHILFLEHAYFSNAGVKSGVTPVKQKNGMPDRRVAYAAHRYDLLVDTRYYGQSSRERIEYIFSQVREVSDTIVMPVLIGEWGAFSGNSPEIADLAKWTLSLFDRLGFSQTYWAQYEGADKALYFTETFLRPYPRYINGTMISSGYNYATGEFMCKWHEPEESGKSSVFFIPNLKNLVREKIILLPSDQNIIIQPGEKGDGGFIIIPPAGKPEERSISLRLEKNVPSISIIGDKD
jgi:endoglycosylceramidase